MMSCYTEIKWNKCMRFLDLKFSFPIVFVHIFTPFSMKVKQNKTERGISSRSGFETKGTHEKSHHRDPAKPKHCMTRGHCQPLGTAPALICNSLGMSLMLSAMKGRLPDLCTSQHPKTETQKLPDSLDMASDGQPWSKETCRFQESLEEKNKQQLKWVENRIYKII